jgi:hypothetical protein
MIIDNWDDDALPWTPPIPLATQEWIDEHCRPFSYPGRIAGQAARKRGRQEPQQEQDLEPQDDERPEGFPDPKP